MPKKIDHEARKQMILQKALEVFGTYGYKDSNLRLIASACGLSRATIYQYFSDKDQIYYYAVKLVTGSMFRKYVQYAWSTDANVIDRIAWICDDVVDTAKNGEDEISKLADVLLTMKEEKRDFGGMLLRRTAKLTILFKRLLRYGIQRGDVIPECDIDRLSEHLLRLVVASCLHVGFFFEADVGGDKDLINTYLAFYKRRDGKKPELSGLSRP